MFGAPAISNKSKSAHPGTRLALRSKSKSSNPFDMSPLDAGSRIQILRSAERVAKCKDSQLKDCVSYFNPRVFKGPLAGIALSFFCSDTLQEVTKKQKKAREEREKAAEVAYPWLKRFFSVRKVGSTLCRKH